MIMSCPWEHCRDDNSCVDRMRLCEVTKHIKKRFHKWYDNKIQFSSIRRLEGLIHSLHTIAQFYLFHLHHHKLKYRLPSIRLSPYNEATSSRKRHKIKFTASKPELTCLYKKMKNFYYKAREFSESETFKLNFFFSSISHYFHCLRCFPSTPQCQNRWRGKSEFINLKEQCETLLTDSLLWFALNEKCWRGGKNYKLN